MKEFEKPLLFTKRVKEMYETKTGKRFDTLIDQIEPLNQNRASNQELNVFDLAFQELYQDQLREMPEEGSYLKVGSQYIMPSDIDLNRTLETCSMDDLLNIYNGLKCNQKFEYILFKYDSLGLWTNTCIPTSVDYFQVYDRFLYQCRSTVINLKTMEVILLPFPKFRNLGESADYSMDVVLEKLKHAHTIEYSEKLDGSFIQMRYIQDTRFWHDCMFTSSNNIRRHPSRIQLDQVYAYLEENGDNYEKLCKDHPDFTFMFEWISIKDMHIVHYDKSQTGLHLIGMRNVKTGELSSYHTIIETAKKYGILCTKLYDETLDHILSQLDQYRANEKEGWVMNLDGFLVKIKCKEFTEVLRIAAHGKSLFNTVIPHLASNTLDDLLATIPEVYQQEIKDVAADILQTQETIIEIAKSYLKKIPEGSQKEQMLYMKAHVPKKILAHVRNLYLNRPVTILGSFLETESPHYLKESELKQWKEWIKKESWQ